MNEHDPRWTRGLWQYVMNAFRAGDEFIVQTESPGWLLCSELKERGYVTSSYYMYDLWTFTMTKAGKLHLRTQHAARGI